MLTQKQIQDNYGLTRAQLLGLEQEGQLNPTRTRGGHRRYDPAEVAPIAKAMMPVEEMNEAVKNPRDNLIFRELGSSGLTRFGGSVFEERLRELRGRAGRIKYREMRLNDPVIAAVFFALINSLRQAQWRVAPASESDADIRAAEFVESCLDDMSFSWHDTLTFVIDPMLEQGFSLLEIVYKKRQGPDPAPVEDEVKPAPSKFDDGRIGWRKLAPRPADSLQEGGEWIFDESGGIKGINQVDQGGQKRTIPMGKLLHFRTTVGSDNNPEPPPIHRAAYLPYVYSMNMAEIEGIGVERNLSGLPVIYLGNDASTNGSDSDYELAKDLVVNIRQDEQAGVVIPGPKMGSGAGEGQGWLLELLSGGGGGPVQDTGDIIERWDKRKALVVLAQFIMLGMEQVGSFALSKSQGDLFILAASAWIDSIADIFNRFAIPRLMALNAFPGLTGTPKLIPSALGVPDLEGIAAFVNGLVEKEVIIPDAELERHLRNIADLPEPQEAEDDGEGMVDKAAVKRNASELSLILSRVRLAMDPLIERGLMTQQDQDDVLQPMVDELLAELRSATVLKKKSISKRITQPRRAARHWKPPTNLRKR